MEYVLTLESPREWIVRMNNDSSRFMCPAPLEIYNDESSSLHITHIRKIEDQAYRLSGSLKWEYIPISAFENVA